VLDEPQQRICDNCVEVVVRALVDGEHVHQAGRVVTEPNAPPRSPVGDHAVFARRGRADPTHARRAPCDISQRGYQSAAASPFNETIAAHPIANRTSVRDNDKRIAQSG
jgi:hypothetical protein